MLAIVGVGLIGGSFALAARAAGLFDRIVGVDTNPVHLAAAQKAGIIDQGAAAVPEAAEAVLLAVPSDRVTGLLEELADHPGLVFDVASVKAPICAAPGPRPTRFVPAHPIAGAERRGPDAARSGLFADHLVVLTPTAATPEADVERLTGWWEALGARVQRMDAAAHDELFALTSHLPHLAAFAYMQLIKAEHLPFAAGGFRDFSRIAAADPDMWVPILRSNQTAILAVLDGLESAFAEFRAAIAAPQPAALRKLLESARDRRLEYPVRS